MSDVVLSTAGLTKRYPGVVALEEVSVELRRHEVLGLIGENGAGKSTLLKVLAGVITPDAGLLSIRGREVQLAGVAQARKAGIGMVFQEQSLIPTISVGENILLGIEGDGRRRGIYRWRRLEELAQAQLDKIGSDVAPRARTEELTFAERQMVELAKVLAIEEYTQHEPIILLDEPTSVLEASEIDTLFRQMERLRNSTSIVFVSHRLDEVLKVADRVYVMRGGRVVAEVAREDLESADLYRLMVGETEQNGHFHDELHAAPDEGRVRLAVAGVTRAGSFEDVDLQVHAGEVFGLVGVQGSGREALCRALFGAVPIDSGTVTLDGRVLDLDSPVEAVRSGIAYLPAERRSEGLLLGMTVTENLTIAHPGQVTTRHLLYPRKEDALARTWIERLRIKTPGPAAQVQTLSGGTQQKVVLARWMVGPSTRLMILDHPTRGLDVGAKSDVYAIIRQLAAAGMAVLLMADTLEETIALADRILVMKDGRSVGLLDAPMRAKPSLVEVVELMV